MTKGIKRDIKLQQVREALLAGKSQAWIEVNLQVSYQTIMKVRNPMQQSGEWPPKPQEKYIVVEGREYMTHDQFRRLLLSVIQETIRDGSMTLEKCVAAGQLMPDGSLPPNPEGFDPDSAFYAMLNAA